MVKMDISNILVCEVGVSVATGAKRQKQKLTGREIPIPPRIILACGYA